MPIQEEIKLAAFLCRQAGDLLRDLQTQKNVEILIDDGKDIKINADKLAEKLILDGLIKHGRYPILSEESGELGDSNIDKQPMWILDPLDGTLNFSRGLSLCCISLALWQGNRPIFGVIYDFNRDELFWGSQEKGAYCNDENISVSSVTQAAAAVLTTGFPVNRNYSSHSIKTFLEDVQKFKKIRMIGSAALSLAYIACGRMDAYYEEDIMLWDIAAGCAIIKAAGGWISVTQSPTRNGDAMSVVLRIQPFFFRSNIHDSL